jgi:hypothetical protein
MSHFFKFLAGTKPGTVQQNEPQRGGVAMHIVAFNSSPRANETSITERVLQRVLTGARQAGAATETFYLRQHRIQHCLGCFECWFKTPGTCIQKDDMTNVLLPKFLEADLVILATPIYDMFLNARMKMFLERMIPLMDMVQAYSGECEIDVQIWRVEKFPRIVALSVCGYPDPQIFQFLSPFMKSCFEKNLVAEIYRHSTDGFEFPELAAPVEAALTAATQAGEELVRLGRVEESTLADLGRDLAPKEQLLPMVRARFLEYIAQGGVNP